MALEQVGLWQKRLEESQIPVQPEENTDCCYARQDKVWFRDPDGNPWRR